MDYILKSTKKKNFTTISNNFLNDPNLSLNAIALGSKLLSKPSNWIINPSALSKELNIGRDKLAKIILELEQNNYLYKKYANIVFAKKGEQKVFYYLSDSKELISEISSLDKNKDSHSQLPLLKTTLTDIPNTSNPSTESTKTQNTTDTNKTNFFCKENIDKKNTKLTLHKALDEVLDSATKHNLLQKRPDITLDEFLELYKKMKLEFDNGYCSNFNGGLILAAAGRWNFRVKSNLSKDEKNARILQSKIDYYLDYFKISSCNPNEVILKFEKETIKYDSDLVKKFSDKLKKELGI